MVEHSKSKRRKPVDFDDFRVWLTNLGMINPSLHVNGMSHPIAALTVDFGTPLVEQVMTSDQSAELVTRLRAATKSLFSDKEIAIRVQSDTTNGVWWSSVG